MCLSTANHLTSCHWSKLYLTLHNVLINSKPPHTMSLVSTVPQSLHFTMCSSTANHLASCHWSKLYLSLLKVLINSKSPHTMSETSAYWSLTFDRKIHSVRKVVSCTMIKLLIYNKMHCTFAVNWVINIAEDFKKTLIEPKIAGLCIQLIQWLFSLPLSNLHFLQQCAHTSWIIVSSDR